SLPAIDNDPNFQPQPQTRKLHQKPPTIGLNIAKPQVARKKIIKEEIQRFHKVIQHSAFKADPLSAVRQHVENTVEKKKSIPNDNSMNIDR
ncbi:7173_t:CDS:2, partial [Cetraspora pellucida]